MAKKKGSRYAARGKDKAVGQTGWDSVARDDLRDALKSRALGFDVTVQVKPGSAKKNIRSIAKAKAAGVNVIVAKGQQYFKSAGAADPATGVRVGYTPGTSAREQRIVAESTKRRQSIIATKTSPDTTVTVNKKNNSTTYTPKRSDGRKRFQRNG